MPTAALTALLLLSLDVLSAHRSTAGLKRQQNDTDLPRDEKKNPPHIIFILIDDQGFNDIGYHNPTIKTPTLDKLAAEGVKLENYYVQPICTPSRSQLLTGRYQIHTGLQHSIIRSRQPSCLPRHMETLPETLRRAGYSTHMVGKWHLGFYRKSCLPTRKGFDTFFGSLTGSVDYYSYGSCDGQDLCGYDLHDNEGVAWGHEGKYSTTLFTQRARKILKNHDPADKPLFLLLSLQAVHGPLQPPKPYVYLYRDMASVARRNFAAMVSTVDDAVRNLVYALRKYGYYKNSVIIYSTDNGAQPFVGGSNWPLRGRKGTYWEGGVRGVAFVHSPLLKRRRRVSTALLHITDWFPTLVGLAGGNTSQSRGLDGFDVWPAISEGKESPRKEILHNIDPLHKPPAEPSGCDHGEAETAAAPKARRPKFKKPKKRVLKLQQNQRSVFRVKNFKKKKVLKQKPNKKSAPELKTTKKPKKIAANPKTKSQKSNPGLKLQAKAQKPKRRSYSEPQSSGSPSESKLSSSKPHLWRPLKTNSKRTTTQEQNLSLSEPARSRTHLKQALGSRQPLGYQNMSLTGTPKPKSRLASHVSAVWDTSVQAAIRVGDWKLLTGDPGHGDWIPVQMLSAPVGPWWNLERTMVPRYKQSVHKDVWLFNITADPYERRDLSQQRPDVVLQLLGRLAFYNRTAVPVYFPPDDPRADPDRHQGAWVPWVDEDDDKRGRHKGVYKKERSVKKLCKLESFFLKLNTGMMSNRI
ncbi:Arylsulfatase I [Oryzias melastigma]|uniref:Arylsulfatase I n=1 Tax=Oryzias melastigma TaxID=30732 RepID=A0A834C9H6_ORYME|nr:Arylsulfatase I [Oryzias melastigma]